MAFGLSEVLPDLSRHRVMVHHNAESYPFSSASHLRCSEQFVPAEVILPLTFSVFFARFANNQWVADGIPFAFIAGIRFAKGKITKTTFRRRYEMEQKDLKKILAGLSITTLVAGASLLGIGYPEAAQGA